MVTNVLKLGYAVLSTDLELQHYFKDYDLDHKIFLILDSAFYRMPFDHGELMFLLNLLLNMATGGEFYDFIEKSLFCKEFFPQNSLLSHRSEKSEEFPATFQEKSPKKVSTGCGIFARTFEEKPVKGPLKLVNFAAENSVNSSSSILLKQLINQRTVCFEEKFCISPNSSSPERRTKKSLTVDIQNIRNNAVVSPKSPLNKLRKQRSEKRPSTTTSLMATHYERELFLEEVLMNYEANFEEVSRHLRVKIPYFLDIIVRFLYEIADLDPSLKLFYVKVLKNMVFEENSYNSAILARDFVVLRLLLALRLEVSKEIREVLLQILAKILANFVNNHQMKAIFILMTFEITLKDFSQSYIKQRKSRAFAKTRENCEMSMLFSDFLPIYAEGLCDRARFFTCVRDLLQLFASLAQKAFSQELGSAHFPEKILSFSGENSGVILTNLRFPIKDFTIFLEIRFENLQKGAAAPRLFTLVGQHSAALDVFLNENREICAELVEKTRVVSRVETQNPHFCENLAYALAISFDSSHESFRFCVNGEELSCKKSVRFSHLPEKFASPKYFSLACSVVLPDSKAAEIKRLAPLSIENSLSCTVFSLKIAENAKNSQRKCLNLAVFEFLSKHNFKSQDVWVSLSKTLPGCIENQQVFLEERPKSRLDFVNRFLKRINNFVKEQRENSSDGVARVAVETATFDVKCKGVSLLERIQFLEFFLMFGNVEVLFYLIDKLARDFDCFDNEKR